jgi:hypothetical protein
MLGWRVRGKVGGRDDEKTKKGGKKEQGNSWRP